MERRTYVHNIYRENLKFHCWCGARSGSPQWHIWSLWEYVVPIIPICGIQPVTDKVHQWKEELQLLVDITKIQPHAAYAAFIHGYVHKFSYLCKTIPNIDPLLQPLEDSIWSQLIPALTGRAPPSDTSRDPCLAHKTGRPWYSQPTKLSTSELKASINIFAPLRDLILEQSHEYSMDCLEAQINAKKDTHRRNRDNVKTSASTLRATISNSLQWSYEANAKLDGRENLVRYIIRYTHHSESGVSNNSF